jgi:uncharacterized protein (DUF433 family)
VLSYLAAGMDEDQILADFPALRACFGIDRTYG